MASNPNELDPKSVHKSATESVGTNAIESAAEIVGQIAAVAGHGETKQPSESASALPAVSISVTFTGIPLHMLHLCISFMPADALINLSRCSKYFRTHVGVAQVGDRYLGQIILWTHALRPRSDGRARLNRTVHDYMQSARVQHLIETGKITVVKALVNVSDPLLEQQNHHRLCAYQLGVSPSEIAYSTFSETHLVALRNARESARDDMQRQIQEEDAHEEKELKEEKEHKEGVEEASSLPVVLSRYAAEIKAGREADNQRRIREAIAKSISHTLAEIYELSAAQVLGIRSGISRLQVLGARYFSEVHGNHLLKLQKEGKLLAEIIKEFEIIKHLKEVQLQGRQAGFEERDYMAEWFSDRHIEYRNKGYDINLLRGLNKDQLRMLQWVRAEERHLISKSKCTDVHYVAMDRIPFALIYDLENHQVKAMQHGLSREEALQVSEKEIGFITNGLPLKIVKMMQKELMDPYNYIKYEVIITEIYNEAKSEAEKTFKTQESTPASLDASQIKDASQMAGQKPESELKESKEDKDEYDQKTGKEILTVAETRERKVRAERQRLEAKEKEERAVKEAQKKREQEFQALCIKIFETKIAEYRGLQPFKIIAMRKAGLKRKDVDSLHFTEKSAELAMSLKQQGKDPSIAMGDLSDLVTAEQTQAVLEYGVPKLDVLENPPSFTHMKILAMRKGYAYKDFAKFTYTQLEALALGIDIEVVKILEKLLQYGLGLELTNLVMIFKEVSEQISQQYRERSGIIDTEIQRAIDEACRRKASELVSLSGFQIKGVAVGLRLAQVKDYHFTSKHADILFALKVSGAKKEEILKRFSEIQYLKEYQIKGLDLGFTIPQVKSHWFSEQHVAAVDYGLNGNTKHTVEEVQGLNFIEVELLDYLPSKKAVLQATIEEAYQDYHLPAIKAGHPYEEIFALSREQVTLVMEFEWTAKDAKKVEVTEEELEGLRLGHQYDDIKGLNDNHIEALKLGIPLDLVKKLKNELALIESVSFMSENSISSSLLVDLSDARSGLPVLPSKMNKIEQFGAASFDIRRVIEEATAEVELEYAEEKGREEARIQAAIYAAFEKKIILLSSLKPMEVQGIRLGLKEEQVKYSGLTIYHINYLSQLRIDGMSKNEISKKFEEIKDFNLSQLLALDFGLDIKKVKERKEFPGVMHWETLVEKGFGIEDILKLNADQAFGLAESNLTLSQVSHKNFCRTIVEIMADYSYPFSQLIQLEAWQLKAMTDKAYKVAGLILTPTSPEWSWLTPGHLFALRSGFKLEQIQGRDVKEVEDLFKKRGNVVAMESGSALTLTFSEAAKALAGSEKLLKSDAQSQSKANPKVGNGTTAAARVVFL